MKRLVRLVLTFAVLLAFGLGCHERTDKQPPVKANSQDVLKGVSEQEMVDRMKPKPK